MFMTVPAETVLYRAGVFCKLVQALNMALVVVTLSMGIDGALISELQVLNIDSVVVMVVAVMSGKERNE